MTKDHDDGKPIRPPLKDQPLDRLRTVASGLADFAPGGGFVRTLIDDLVPTGAAKARNKWEISISDRVNEHGQTLAEHNALLFPQTTLQACAANLAVALAKACPNGLGRMMYERSDIYALLPDVAESDIDEAVWELESVQLVHLQRFLGGGWALRLQPAFYDQIDVQVMGWNPAEDAIALAQIVLDSGQTRAGSLHELSGWSSRRFNPAFRRVLDVIGEGAVSREIQSKYVASYFILGPESRSRLKRMLREQGV